MRMGAKFAAGFNSRRLHHIEDWTVSEPEIKTGPEFLPGPTAKIVPNYANNSPASRIKVPTAGPVRTRPVRSPLRRGAGQSPPDGFRQLAEYGSRNVMVAMRR